MKIKAISGNEHSIRGKKVILRLDLNVSFKGRKIANDFKLQSSLPTVKRLLSLGCAVIILTHIGEPKAGQKPLGQWSVKPLAFWFEKKLKKQVPVVFGNWGAISKQVKKLAGGQLLMLENIRCFRGETENSLALAKRLAALGEVYINDAFAVSHRAHASVNAIQKYVPSFAGPLLESEIKNLEQARKARSPFVLILGGAKITTKLPLLKNSAPKASAVLIGGGIANTFLASQGYDVGKSLCDYSALKLARRLLTNNMLLPIDVVVASRSQTLIKNSSEVKPGDTILDIGPKTVALFSKKIAAAKTIAWNGPLGMFEKKGFEIGTNKIAKAVSLATKKGAYTVVGGGETVTAAGANHFSWVSTGGGAALAYLAGEKLPGLARIVTL